MMKYNISRRTRAHRFAFLIFLVTVIHFIADGLPSLGDAAIIHGNITMSLPLGMAIVRHLTHNFPQKIKHVISFHTMFSVNNKAL
jgi:hypothetical protein